MGNIALRNQGTAVAAYEGNPWAEAARGVETGAYLKFNGNDGFYSFGQDDEDLPHGSRAVGDMESLALGWICWKDGDVEEEILVPVVQGRAPLEHELPDHGPYGKDDGWREAASISLVLESYGQDDQDEAVGTPLLWKTSTGGQVRQIKKLSGAYGRLFAQHPGEYPVVELSAESYVPKNKAHGKIKWSPSLKIVGWLSEADLAGLTGGEADFEEPAPAPAAIAAPARGRAAPVEEPAAPARGRRAAAPVEEPLEDEPPFEEDEVPAAPAPRGRRTAAAAPAEDEGDEAAAPAPRGRSRPSRGAPVEDEQEEAPAAPAPRGRRAAAPAAEEEAPAAPARGAGRGAPAANARLRRFD